MTQTSIHSIVKSAVAITGAGSAVYLDAIADEIIRGFHKYQDSDIAAFEAHLRDCVAQFHAKHVTPLPAHLAREVYLIVGAQIENRHALWATDVSVVKPSLGFEAVGSGHPYARMAIQHRAVNLNAETAAILAAFGVAQAKEYDGYCGKSTTITFLKNNIAYEVPPYEIDEAEHLFQTYGGIEYSSLLFALTNKPVSAKLPRKLNHLLRNLRKQFAELASRLLEHQP